MSEDIEVLNCPACGAAVHPPAGQSEFECPYCHNTVRVAPAAQGAGRSRPDPAREKEQADQVMALIHAGKQEEAIQFLMQTNGVSRADAEELVEALADT